MAVFVGADPDNTVQAWAINHNVRILFSTDRLLDRLAASLPREYADQIYVPPDMAEIQKVVGVFNAAGLPQVEVASEANPAPMSETDLTARQVIIQHADNSERLHCRGWRRRSKRRRQRQGRQGGGPGYDLTNGCPARAPSVRS